MKHEFTARLHPAEVIKVNVAVFVMILGVLLLQASKHKKVGKYLRVNFPRRRSCEDEESSHEEDPHVCIVINIYVSVG